MTDASNYKRAYEIQKKARQQAERLLEDKSRELFEKNQSLEKALVELEEKQHQIVMQEKLASIGQLGAGLAHELNNPNAFIQNNLQTLKEYAVNLFKAQELTRALLEESQSHASAAEQEAYQNRLKQIETDCEINYIKEDIGALFDETEVGTQRITNIANGLRYFANPEDSTRKAMDIEECISQSKRLISEQELDDIRIICDLPKLPQLNGLPMLFSQALANILKNALAAKPKSKTVMVTACRAEECIKIVIEDDGCGIDPEIIDKVREPFFTTSKTGNGLGLAIAQNIINQHDGELNIESQINSFTKVTITLPLL